ncbi:hypothetical protein [Streptosporangium sp. NPDC000509]|uniref:hypothetical protein n=1 Tax=Streptosporangium sp. NPDC000509 TaxID=3366186 RepID=UPI0036B16B5A
MSTRLLTGPGWPSATRRYLTSVSRSVVNSPYGWDLARTTGQEYEPDPEAVSRALDFTGRMAETGRQRGTFGPPVAVPDDAPRFDHLLGLIGRDPAWTP